MKVLFALLVLIPFVLSEVALLPEDLPILNAPGECASGLPADGRFKSCQLSSWRVGARALGQWVRESDIDFTSDFPAPHRSLLQWAENDTTSTCAMSVPPSGVVFQHLDKFSFAHYRMTACAKVHGTSPCRVEVRDWNNRVVDSLEFWAPSNRSCLDTENGRRECSLWSASSIYTHISIRYQGLAPNMVAIRRADLLTDNSNDLIFQVSPGEEFNISASDLGLTEMPDRLAFITGANANIIDIVTLSGNYATLPGQYFGDNKQFLMSRAWTSSDLICPISDVADLPTCPCEEADVAPVCLQSFKGFVAHPDLEYYIGLVSGECTCEFDSICMEQVGNEEGYFGVPWVQLRNSTSSGSNDFEQA